MPSICSQGSVEEPIDSAPGKGTVRATTLQCEIDKNAIVVGGLGFGGCQPASSFSDRNQNRTSRSAPPWQVG